MAHEIIPIERIQREALKAELLYINANDANPYPHQSRAAQVFWASAAADSRISARFRVVCDANLRELERLTALA